MAFIARQRRIVLSAALLLCTSAARAIQSGSVDFTNTRSAMSSGGMRKTSASFRVDSSIGTLAQSAENSVHFHGRDGLITGYYYPASATVSISTVYINGTASLLWISPGNDGNEHSTPGGYIVRYSSVAAQAPGLSDALFNAATNVSPAPPAAAVGGSTVTMTVNGLTPGVVYYFAMKTYERDGTRSVLSKSIQDLNLPQEPYGIALATGPISATLRWFPVVRYTDGISYNIPSAPVATELNGYQIYRATAAVHAPWTAIAFVSTATLTYTDYIVGGPYYYCVSASNNQGFSPPSVIRSVSDMSAWVVAPDGSSFFQIPQANVLPVEGEVGYPNSAYLITASDRPQDLGTLGGTVMKSLEFDAYAGGVLLAPNLPIPGLGNLNMNYQTSPLNGNVMPSGVAATASDLSTYWYNGTSWVQLYGTNDNVDQVMVIKTLFVGKYQLRAIARTGGFTFSMAGVSNRMLSPNGDHKNDNVVFTYDNPQGSNVTIKILDMRGRVVASSLPQGPTSNSQVWDGTSGGRSVGGGVYIYQIQSEGQTYTGTLVVIK